MKNIRAYIYQSYKLFNGNEISHTPWVNAYSKNLTTNSLKLFSLISIFLIFFLHNEKKKKEINIKQVVKDLVKIYLVNDWMSSSIPHPLFFFSFWCIWPIWDPFASLLFICKWPVWEPKDHGTKLYRNNRILHFLLITAHVRRNHDPRSAQIRV